MLVLYEILDHGGGNCVLCSSVRSVRSAVFEAAIQPNLLPIFKVQISSFKEACSDRGINWKRRGRVLT